MGRGRRRRGLRRRQQQERKNLAEGHVPSFLRMFLFTSRGELILLCGLGREELFEVLAATAAMIVT